MKDFCINHVSRAVFLVILTLVAFPLMTLGQSNDDCLACHDDPALATIRLGKSVSLFVNGNSLSKSVHKDVLCASCHPDAKVEDYPHPENLNPVNCGSCHEKPMQEFDKGIHGQALQLKALYAPDCKECHGTHNILPNADPKSLTYKMNVPVLCGKCHREGAPVQRTYNIGEQNILENYSQSIHGEGLFKRGLIVTATCNDCHGNHLILPHTSPNSTISVNNIAKTCMKCHAEIEKVHTKIIKKELWEKEPGAIPACTDCHPPHRVDVTNIVETISDRSCLQCHEQNGLHKMVNDTVVSLTVNKDDIKNSVHINMPCVKCHSDVSVELRRHTRMK
jgi:predicted CXXCH cytochrome family protein